MKTLNKLLALLAPDICVSCGSEGLALCDECQNGLSYPDRCYRCKKPSPSSLTCETCKKHTSVTALYCFSSYEGCAKLLVSRAKYGPSRTAARLMGEILAKKLPYLEVESLMVAHIPTTPSRIRERAFDQAQEMTKGISTMQNVVRASLLFRLTKSHQVGSTRKQRQEHMLQAFGAKNEHLFRGKTVLLVDDVLTTGSTMESAARTLKKAGAKRVLGAVFARAE